MRLRNVRPCLAFVPVRSTVDSATSEARVMSDVVKVGIESVVVFCRTGRRLVDCQRICDHAVRTASESRPWHGECSVWLPEPGRHVDGAAGEVVQNMQMFNAMRSMGHVRRFDSEVKRLSDWLLTSSKSGDRAGSIRVDLPRVV